MPMPKNLRGGRRSIWPVSGEMCRVPGKVHFSIAGNLSAFCSRNRQFHDNGKEIRFFAAAIVVDILPSNRRKLIADKMLQFESTTNVELLSDKYSKHFADGMFTYGF